jgi:hypothetical protein
MTGQKQGIRQKGYFVDYFRESSPIKIKKHLPSTCIMVI